MCKVNLQERYQGCQSCNKTPFCLVCKKYFALFAAILFPSFTFNYNNNCYLKESAKLSNMNESTAGWCPKGNTNKQNGGIQTTECCFLGRRQHGDREVPTQPVDMMCTNKGSLCQFPYKLRGKVSQFYIQKMNPRDMDVSKKTSYPGDMGLRG